MSPHEQILSDSFGRLYWTLHDLRQRAAQRGAQGLVSQCDDLKGRVWVLGLHARRIAGTLAEGAPQPGGRS